MTSTLPVAKRSCDPKRGGCGRSLPDSAFTVIRDGQRLKTAICAECIRRKDVEHNKDQRQQRLNVPKTQAKNVGTDPNHTEFLLRESIEQIYRRKEKERNDALAARDSFRVVR